MLDNERGDNACFGLDVGRPLKLSKSTETKTAGRRTGTLSEGETERRNNTSADFLSPPSRGSRLCPISSHMAGLHLYILTAPSVPVLFFLRLLFYSGKRLFRPAMHPPCCFVPFIPGCHHRAHCQHMSGCSRTREKEEGSDP